MSLKTEDHALESDGIVGIVCPIPSEMQVDAAAAQLRTKIAAWQQLIRPNQHVDTPGQAG